MAFNKFGGGGGGKKGPRAHNGSFKNKGKLKPQPAAPFQDATKPAARALKKRYTAEPSPEPDAEGEDADDEEEEFGYHKAIIGEAKPLSRAVVSVTGCSDVKVTLLETVSELGGGAEASLTERVTHLVADRSGTPKFDAAIKHGMKVMSRDWLPAIRDAWRSAVRTDFGELEEIHRLPPFAKLYISLTGFAQGEYKDAFRALLSYHGATVTPNVTAETTHIIVASPSSPHSQDNFTKLTQVQHPRYRNIKTVWEGWANEVVDAGGVRSDRETVWAWTLGKGEPTSDELKEVDPRRAAAAKVDGGTSGQEQQEYDEEGEKAHARRIEHQDEATELAAVAKSKKTRAGRKDAGQVSDLIDNYIGGGRHGDSNASSSSIPPLPIANDATNEALASAFDRDLAAAAPSQPGAAPAAAGGKGKSILQALATRSRFEGAAENKTRPTPLIPGAVKPPPSAVVATEADDSAFFDNPVDVLGAGGDKAETQGDGWNEDPIFAGTKIALMSLAERSDTVKGAITSRGGVAWVNEREDEADWIVVPVFGAPERFLTSDDPRLVTHFWIENCIFEEAVVPPANRLLERPVSYEVPLPSGPLLSINTSGFDEAEATHIKYFVKQLGGTTGDTFDRTRSHLIHSAVDDDQEPTGPKVVKAREWGIPIVGVKWLRDWAQEQADERDADARRLSLERKGKGRALERSHSSSFVAPTPVDDEEDFQGPLDGCIVAFSSKVSCDRTALSDIVESLGGKVLRAYSADVTHLIHAGKKSNESFKEFKRRPSELEIVHPRWIEEARRSSSSAMREELCLKLKKQANELDFPYLYNPKKSGQLAGLVNSPPRSSRQSSVRGTSRGASKAPSQSMPPPPLRRASRAPTAPPAPAPAMEEQEAMLADEEPAVPLEGAVLDDLDTTAEEATTELDYLSPPNSRQPDPRPASQHDERDGDNAAAEPATSSSPKVSAAVIVDPGTSSDPVDEIPAPKSAPRHGNVLLKEQTSALLLSLENAPLEDPTTKRKARIGRKRSAADSIPTSGASDHVAVLPPAPDVPRRIPGGGFEPSQYTQTEDYSLDVTFEDPAALRARQQILAALANGPVEAPAPVVAPEPARKGRKRASAPDADDEDAPAVEPVKKGRTPARKRLARPARILYAVSFILAIVLAACELGLVSQQFQNGGNDAGNYPGREFKYNLGIILFTIILTLIVSLFHTKIGMKLTTFAVFVLAVFWGTGAGIIFQVSPFHVYSCKFDVATFDPLWQPFYSQCSRIVAIEAFAWSEFGLMCLILILIMVDCVTFTIHREDFYAPSVEEKIIIEKEKAKAGDV